MLKTKLNQFLSFLDLPQKPLIGVDISASTIKMVELSQKRDGSFVLEHYAIEPTPKDIFSDQGVAKQEELSQALQKTFKKLNSKHKNIAISLPTTNVIAKKIHLSNQLDDDGLETEILEEAAQLIPFPLDEVHVDWFILGQHVSNPEHENDILVCAARKDRITEYLASVEAAGLKVDIVDVEQFAHQRALEQLGKSIDDFYNKVIALVDAGSTVLTLSIYNNGNNIFYKEVPFGTNQLTESIMQTYGCPPDQAEKAKKENGNNFDNYHEQVLQPFLDSFGMEINRALQFFLTQASVEKIDNIVLSGGGATLEQADDTVANLTQIPTISANPFANMELSSKIKQKSIEKEAPLLFTATGLALRQFDN